eukprot:COSAG05_NODE_389_length_10436_cov_116.442875_3_plen_66_part_00
MHSFIRSTQLQSELHVAFINRVCGHAAKQTDTNLLQSFIRSVQLQPELHAALINRESGHAAADRY